MRGGERQREESFSAQSPPSFCKDVLFDSERHRPIGGHPRPFEHQHNTDLHHGDGRSAQKADPAPRTSPMLAKKYTTLLI